MRAPSATIGILLGTMLASPCASADEAATWVDQLDFSGDFRLRYEGIDEDGVEERNRARFRARFGLELSATDDIDLVFRIATGGNNPVSTNQTFDTGFSTKDIGIDRAYVDWRLTDEVRLLGGKMTNPLFRAGGTQLIWDNDLAPEGFAARFASEGYFGTLVLFSAEERSAADDSLLYGLQGGTTLTLFGEADLVLGFGYFEYTDTLGNEPFFDGDPRGNSVDAGGDYLFEYANVELFAQYDTRFADLPVSLFAHLTRNEEAPRQDTGWAAGVRIGSADERGDYLVGWTYMDIEADAVIATFNDSNFGGGETDSSGHILEAEYMLRDRIGLAATLFLNDVDSFVGNEHDYSRIQLDVEFNFD